VQTAKTDFAGIEHFLDSGHQRDADAVAQLDQVKSKFALDFAEHRVASGVASGIPARGKGNHWP